MEIERWGETAGALHLAVVAVDAEQQLAAGVHHLDDALPLVHLGGQDVAPCIDRDPPVLAPPRVGQPARKLPVLGEDLNSVIRD